MHRKAEEEVASSASGDDENAARRRLGAEMCVEFVARDTSVPCLRSVDVGWRTAGGMAAAGTAADLRYANERERSQGQRDPANAKGLQTRDTRQDFGERR